MNLPYIGISLSSIYDPAKYYDPLRSKWRYTLRLSDGDKRQFIPIMVDHDIPHKT